MHMTGWLAQDAGVVGFPEPRLNFDTDEIGGSHVTSWHLAALIPVQPFLGEYDVGTRRK